MSVKRNGITVNVSPDKMYAFLSLQPQENVKVMPEDIYLLLEEEGITHGIDVEAIKSLCSTSGRIQKQLIAAGVRSVPGQDAVVTYKYEKPDFKPQMTQDGNVDYYELGNIIEVQQGDILAERVPPTQGTPGYNIFGEVLHPVPGKNKPFRVGKGVVIEDNIATAEYNGSLDWQMGKVSVSRMFTVKGDVDFSIGNIDFPGKVKIIGNVLTGFRVEAEEDVEIIGCIEDATVISHKGSVFVHAGIIGTGKAVVQAYNNVEARFIQKAFVEARKNIVSNEYIIRSDINAGNAVLIQGMRGRLLGTNQINAGTQIRVNAIQSHQGMNLSVKGISRNTTYVRMKEISQEIKDLEEELRSDSVKIRLLGEKKDAQSIATLKTMLPQYVSKTERIDHLKEENRYLALLLRTTKGEGMIEVRSRVDQDVCVAIKGKQLRLETPVKNVTMYFDQHEQRIIVLSN